MKDRAPVSSNLRLLWARTQILSITGIASICYIVANKQHYELRCQMLHLFPLVLTSHA